MAELASSIVYGDFTVTGDGHISGVISGDGSGLTGTASLRATGTTKADVGLSGIPNTNSSTSNYLRGDGSWVTPPNTNTTYSAGSGISLSGTTFSVAGGAGLTQNAGGLSLNGNRATNNIIERVKIFREDSVAVAPVDFTTSIVWKFTQEPLLNSPPGIGIWRTVATMQGWTHHNNNYPAYQMSFGNSAVAVRQSTSTTAWGSWRQLKESSNHVAGGSQTLINNRHIVATSAGRTMTLPSSPPVGSEVYITTLNFTNTTVARNGQNIMSLAENMTIDRANTTVTLRFVDSTRGWVIV